MWLGRRFLRFALLVDVYLMFLPTFVELLLRTV